MECVTFEFPENPSLRKKLFKIIDKVVKTHEDSDFTVRVTVGLKKNPHCECEEKCDGDIS
jgi:hypothetical protein